MSRKIKLSGSSQRYLEKALSLGWRPGRSPAGVLRDHRPLPRHVIPVPESARAVKALARVESVLPGDPAHE